MIRNSRRARGRRGTAAVEMAMVAPFLTLAALGTVDYGLCLRTASAVTECARSGASVAVDPSVGTANLSAEARDAAKAAAADFDPNDLPTFSVATGTDAEGMSYVEVTATYTFHGPVGGPTGLPSVQIVRKVRMMCNAGAGS